MHRLEQDPTVRMRAVLDPLIGERLGEYEVVEKLSEGGMGAVYRGVHRLIGKPVAIKVLLPHSANDRAKSQRLLAEARAVNAARHPNIVDIFGFGTAPDGRPYFVMELLIGQPLSGLQRCAGKLELGDVVSVLVQVMEALCAAHAAGVVHRDLKPSNLFAVANGGALKIKVLDFGLARALTGPLSGLSTLPGAVLGTPGFMAPEQITWPSVGPAADIYAMGAVTFLLATGREVFCADSDIEKLRAHLDETPPTLRSLGAPAPRALEALVAAMLAKDPRHRPTAPQVLAAALRLRADLQAAETTQLEGDWLRFHAAQKPASAERTRKRCLSPFLRPVLSPFLRNAHIGSAKSSLSPFLRNAAAAGLACVLVCLVAAVSSTASAHEAPAPIEVAAAQPQLAPLAAIEISLEDVTVDAPSPRASVTVKPSSRDGK